MKWLRRAGLALAALLVAVGFSMLNRPKRRLRKAEASRDQLILDGSDQARAKAMKLGQKADKLQAHADEAKATGKAAINRVGKDHEDMRGILDSWRSDSM